MNNNNNNNNREWKCPICGHNAYRTVDREPQTQKDGSIHWVSIRHFCKGCTIYFRDPARFNLDNMPVRGLF